MKLSTYFRSTAAYRVRIGLNLKELDHQLVPVHLLRDGGEHKTPEYLAANPDGLIPSLETDGHVLAQSMAILEYLEEVYPDPSLLPSDPFDRAYLRGIAYNIICDIHPLNNLRVLQYLKNQIGTDDESIGSWYRHWIDSGFTGIETRLARSSSTGTCCFGDVPTLADVCLIPQVYNAKRFDCPLDDYPTINRINDHCLSLPAFAAAAPQVQADAE